MKRPVVLFFLMAILTVSCATETPHTGTSRVLLFVPERSPDLEFMLANEAGVMKEILMQSGFEVIVATESGEALSAGAASLVPDMKVADVRTEDFGGFVLACMAVYHDQLDKVSPDAVSMVEKAAAEGKPVAAQYRSVVTLAKAGILSGRKFAFAAEDLLNQWPYFEDATYAGNGVVRDGKIVTSGACPMGKKLWGFPDPTPELIDTFIEAMGGRP